MLISSLTILIISHHIQKVKDGLNYSNRPVVVKFSFHESEVVRSTVKFVLRTSEVDFAVAKSVIRSKTS